MRAPSRRVIPLASLAAFVLAGHAAADPVKARFVEAELVSEVHAIKAGEPFWIGLRLVMDPEWHTYWQNPGDSGLPTTVKWELPDGFDVSGLHWPYPQRFVHPPYVSYGYEDEVLLIAKIEPPAELPQEELSMSARADWTVCREDLCVPGGADLTLELPVTAEQPEPDTYWRDHFERTRERLPRPSQDWQATARLDGRTIKLELTGAEPRDPGTIVVFERDTDVIDRDAPVVIERNGRTIEIALPLDADGKRVPERLDAVLLAFKHWDEAGRIKALDVSVPIERP